MNTQPIYPKLNGRNYRLWSVVMRAHLIDILTWDVVSGATPAPAANTPAHKTWTKKSTKAWARIILSVEPEQLIYLQNTTCGAKAWQILKNIHQPEKRAERLTTPEMLVEFVTGGGSRDVSVEVRAAGIAGFFMQLLSLDGEVWTLPDLLKIAVLFKKVPKEFEVIYEDLYREADETCKRVCTRLEEEERKIEWLRGGKEMEVGDPCGSSSLPKGKETKRGNDDDVKAGSWDPRTPPPTPERRRIPKEPGETEACGQLAALTINFNRWELKDTIEKETRKSCK